MHTIHIAQDGNPTLCFTGVVTVTATPIGAVLGLLTPGLGTPIPLRQVVGPAGGPVPLTAVAGRRATVCGQFVPDNGQTILNVTQVIPAPIPIAVFLLLLAALSSALL